MAVLKKILLYLRTTRHLRWTQLWHQLRRRVSAVPEPGHSPKGERLSVPRMIAGCERRGRYVGPFSFRFLNHAVAFGDAVDWSASEQPLLWRYNLHYFEYLSDPTLDRKTARGLILDWIERHPYGRGSVGWEPYPASLRIVAWMRWLAGESEEIGKTISGSLWRQLEHLSHTVEWHILGNHLFVNGKALLFGGVLFGNRDWEELGRRILRDQIEEQFLTDGAQFELSPMYHALAVEDLLDVVSLGRATKQNDGLFLRAAEVAGRSLGWLRVISAGGSAVLLNDAAEGICSDADELSAYAARLGIEPVESGVEPMADGWSRQDCSGYQVMRNGDRRLIFDAAPIGPDYLPGHSHCDMLSVLLDVGGRPVLTDTGVFEYAESPRRTYSRSTAGHNTVSIDSLEQAEIWKSFRVGRRGHPVGFEATGSGVACGHDGFARFVPGLKHVRSVEPRADGFVVSDRLEGRGRHSFLGRWHFAPGLVVEARATGGFAVRDVMSVRISGCEVRLIETEFFPEYGLVERRPCLEFHGEFTDRINIDTQCTFCS